MFAIMGFATPLSVRVQFGNIPGIESRNRVCRGRFNMTGNKHDLVVVGAGALGLRAARLWRERYRDAKIVCATRSDSRHKELAAAGFIPALAEELQDSCTNVLFCAPPSGATADGYAGCVGNAAELASFRFVFTSATSVYADVAQVTEASALNDSPRAQRLRDAEQRALGFAGGSVLRLGGLYDLERGPHSVWLRKGVCTGGADGMLNMVHYDDAAQAAVAALVAPAENAAGRCFVAVDGTPLTRGELCEAARAHPLYAELSMPQFGSGGNVKCIDGSWTRDKLQWTPKYDSFARYFAEQARLVNAQGVRTAAQ